MRSETADLMKLKVVVIGVENSGKTTLINKLSPGTKSVEHSGKDGKTTAVGFDMGKMELAGCFIHLFGTPGEQRFEFARKIAFRGAHMGILMVDSVEPISERERNLEQELIESNLPYVVCASKRDIPDALPLSEIQMNFSADVQPITLNTDSGVDDLRDLLANIIESKKHSWLVKTEKNLTSA